jgi:hypothetical protein
MDFSARQSRDFIGDTIGDDTILINLKTGAYYSLTSLAGSVWAKVDRDSSEFSPEEFAILQIMIAEGIFVAESIANPESAPAALSNLAPVDSSAAFVKYTEMSELLLADPIHEVDEDGWPKLR